MDKQPSKSKLKPQEEENLMQTPMVKSSANSSIKISKEEQMKLQNQKIVDDFFDKEEDQMMVMRLPNTVGDDGSSDESDGEKK